MRLFATVFLVVLFGGSFLAPCQADEGEGEGEGEGGIRDYLDKGGLLKEKLKLHFSMTYDKSCTKHALATWTIEPSGEWTQATSLTTWLVLLRSDKAKGKLTHQQLLALGHHLAAQNFNGLSPGVSKQSPGKNPITQTVRIEFGKKSSVLDLSAPYPVSADHEVGFHSIRPGDFAPPPGDPLAGEWSRFVALTLVLEDLLQRSRIDPPKSK